MWFSYENQPAHWHVLPVAKVKEILALNKQSKKIAAIEDFAIEDNKEVEKNFQNVVGQDSLTRFDRPKSKSKSRSKNTKNQNSGKGQNQGKNNPTQEKNPKQVKNQNQDKPQNTEKNQNTKSNKPKKRRKPSNNQNNAPKKD